MHAFSPRYDDALILAARAHRPQSRKGSDIPYIVHPVHVSVILLRYGFAEDLVIAGLLHDVVEDQDVTLEQIEAQFGAQVAEVVAAVTEQKEDETGQPRPWEDRKREALAHLREASPEILAVKAADVIHNTRTLADQVWQQGPAIWAYYHRGADESLWYYRSMATIAGDRLGAHPIVDELGRAVQDLELAVAESRGGDKKRLT
jgi:(p)ppGpp synthase/HD superfamily hydrolase